MTKITKLFYLFTESIILFNYNHNNTYIDLPLTTLRYSYTYTLHAV